MPLFAGRPLRTSLWLLPVFGLFVAGCQLPTPRTARFPAGHQSTSSLIGLDWEQLLVEIGEPTRIEPATEDNPGRAVWTYERSGPVRYQRVPGQPIETTRTNPMTGDVQVVTSYSVDTARTDSTETITVILASGRVVSATSSIAQNRPYLP